MTGPAPNTVAVEAPAKVNLFLRVLGARPDGFHELETAIVPISLADGLEIHAYSDPSDFSTLSLALSVDGDPALIRDVPTDESNLALRAAMKLADRARPLGFADIVLHKRVPAQAGLGGGSSDAAAVLRTLNRLWGCALDAPALREVAAEVGSDVPALLDDRPVLARGRGERVQPIDVTLFRLALVFLPFGIRTADAFHWWDEDGGVTGPDPGSLLRAASEGGGAPVGGLLFNDLEAPVIRRFPQVEQAKQRLLEAGAAGAVMCGSGPTVAGVLAEGRPFSLPGAVEVGCRMFTGDGAREGSP